MSRLAAICCLALGAEALAHGSATQAYAVHLEGNGRAVVNTTLGAFLTTDDGASWDWVCEEATGPGRSPAPVWFRSGSGAWFVHDYSGLSVTRDGACTFERIPAFDATGVTGMAAAGGALFATTGRYGQTNGILRSGDDGATWSAPVVSSTLEFFSAIQVAPSLPSRLYVSAWWFDPTYTMGLYRSDDGGAGFTRADLTAALPEPGAFYVLAVHPQKPDVVLGALTAQRAPNPGLVLRSSNGGASWTLLFEAPLAVNEAVFSADGARAWVSAGNTVYESTDEGATFTALQAPTRDACAAALGQALYACGNELIDGFVVGRKTGGEPFAPFMRWGAVTGQRSCPAGSHVEQQCTAIWPVARAAIALLRADDPDGGAGGGDGGGAGGGGGGGQAPCGCGAAPGALGAAAIVLLLPRRRPRRW